MACDLQEYDSCSGHENYKLTANFDICGKVEKLEFVLCKVHRDKWLMDSKIDWNETKL